MSNTKYDDTDYLINREESIEYKTSDTNDGSIKEDIMSEEAFNELIDNFEVVETLTRYGRGAIKQNVKKLQKRIKELEEENATLRKAKNIAKEVKIEDITQVMNKSYEEFMKQFVSKQKVKDKIEEINKKYEDSKDENGESPYYYPEYTIRVLEKLSQEREEK